MYQTVYDIELKNRQSGRFFFSKDTKRFFKSRIGNEVYGGCYFITSEKFNDDSPRLYTIRKASPDGDVSTVGKFQAFKTSAQARSAINRILLGVDEKLSCNLAMACT